MHTKSETQKLVSAFVVASLAFNFLNPLPIGVPFADEEITAKDAASSGQLSEIHGFAKPHFDVAGAVQPPFPTSADTKTITIDPLSATFPAPILVGQTSFIAPKIPPNKKQVVVSRQWIFVTAYSSTPDQTDDTPFITASGSHVRDGVIAANFLRIGTRVRIPSVFGHKVFVVEDRMNSRYYYRLDIWMPSREEAKQFGAKILPIEVIKEI